MVHLADLWIMNFISGALFACYSDCEMIKVLKQPLCMDLLII